MIFLLFADVNYKRSYHESESEEPILKDNAIWRLLYNRYKEWHFTNYLL